MFLHTFLWLKRGAMHRISPLFAIFDTWRGSNPTKPLGTPLMAIGYFVHYCCCFVFLRPVNDHNYCFLGLTQRNASATDSVYCD